MALVYTEFEVDDVSFHIFTLPDRRPTAGSSQPVKWLYQMDVESFLYNHDDETRGTGAFYRLLQRTPGAAGRALCLRKNSIGMGLITDDECTPISLGLLRRDRCPLRPAGVGRLQRYRCPMMQPARLCVAGNLRWGCSVG